MRTVLGAAVGYLGFLIIGAIALIVVAPWLDLEATLASGRWSIPALWMVIGLFVVGGVSGIAGRIATRVGDRPEAALLLGLVIAVQGLIVLSNGADGTELERGLIGSRSSFELLTLLEVPEWYTRCLPLFAAAFIGYGGYQRQA